MVKLSRALAVAATTLVLLTTMGCYSDSKATSQENTPANSSQDYTVGVSTLVDERGGRVDWGPNDVIAHCRYGEDGYYDLWTMNTDGTEAECLTCDKNGIPQLHNGQPRWHTSGEWIIFQSQDPALPHTPMEDYWKTQPGFGKHNNLWVTDTDGEVFYQLTEIEENRSILHAFFSHDGSTLLWSEKTGDWATNWAIMIADFVEDPEPHLENVTALNPLGEVWYETHGFSPDDSRILFTAGTGDSKWAGFDIWEMELNSMELTRLTHQPDVWDEHAHYSPDGSKIVWASSHGYPYDTEASTYAGAVRDLKLDYWIMDADGSNKTRLTYFNEPGHEHYGGGQVIVADSSWNPEGDKLVATALFGKGRENTKILLIELTKTGEPLPQSNVRHENADARAWFIKLADAHDTGAGTPENVLNNMPVE